MARQKSRNTDFTKADAYDGLIRVYQARLEEAEISGEEHDKIKAQIENFKLEKDKINKNLNRHGWQLRQNHM